MAEEETPNLVGKEPSRDKLDWLDYFREARRDGFRNANDTAKIILGSTSALTTAYLAILSAFKIADRIPSLDMLGLVLVLLPLSLFIVSGLLSIVATIPRTRGVSAESPSEIQAFHETVMGCKMRLVWGAFGFLAFGIMVAGTAIFFVLL